MFIVREDPLNVQSPQLALYTRHIYSIDDPRSDLLCIARLHESDVKQVLFH